MKTYEVHATLIMKDGTDIGPVALIMSGNDTQAALTTAAKYVTDMLTDYTWQSLMVGPYDRPIENRFIVRGDDVASIALVIAP